MKKVLLVAVVLLLATPVLAQGPFTDVPTDHWAYDAVDQLQREGVIIGYPDGTFSGKRMITRYEFAIAIARLWGMIPEAGTSAAGLTKADVEAMLSGYAKTSAIPTVPTLANLATKADVDAIRKLVDEFRDEIAALGVDVDALKRDVAALSARVDAVEVEQRRVRFTGDVTVFGRASSTRDGYPMDLDGRELNEDLITDIDVIRDMDLKVVGRVGENVTANATINYGNYLNYIGYLDDYAGYNGGGWEYANGGWGDDFFPYYLNIEAGVGQGALTVGRFPLQFTPYTLKMIDVDSYTNILKTSDGNYPVDGAKLAINLFGVDWTWFAVKNDQNQYMKNGLTGQPYGDMVMHQAVTGNAVGGLNQVTQTAGVRFSLGLPMNAVLGGTFYQAWDKSANPLLDQARVFGADLSIPVPFLNSMSLDASWTRSDTIGEGYNVDYLNEALDGKLSFAIGGLDVGAGYKDIGRNFAAAGAWDKIGYWTNPTNIKGPYAELAYAFGQNVKFCVNGEFLKFKDDVDDMIVKDDKIIKAEGMLKWGITDKSSINASYEWVRFDPTGEGDALSDSYLTLGIGHQFNPNAKLSVGYQLINQEMLSEGKSKGGVGVVQFGVTF